MDLLPPVAERRAHLERARDEFRTHAYLATISLAALGVQKAEHVLVRDRLVPRADHVRELTESIENGRAAAAEMQRLLAELPEETR